MTTTTPGGAAPGRPVRLASSGLPAARRRALGRDRIASGAVLVAAGLSVLIVALVIIFLAIRATPVITDPAIGLKQFFTSSNWQPDANIGGFGTTMSTFGALSPIAGTLAVTGLALLIAVPLSLSLALVLVEANPALGERYLRSAIELFVGIPSVVYGYLGFVILLPLLKPFAPAGADGSGILAAGFVLSIMITPTITALSADGLHAVPRSLKEASMALGATQWQTMRKVLLPAARASIISGVVLGMARAMGEALAVALVIGDVNVLDVKSNGIRALLKPFTTMTVTITDGVNNVTINPQGAAARYMLALVLLVMTFLCIVIVRYVNRNAERPNQ
ncbi:MAG TPA: phosphate ABC transporter permease subunit PstC [Candidatus Dormibacteraeota bacterium]